jgi:EAL domain-containing protein (putative c-di-GMP-specific phosphodiesterase class I)
VRSVEALIRWTHPVRGVVSSLEFISRAEENGLIECIGEWVLRTACADAARWSREGLRMRVAVNLSPLQLRCDDLPKLVATVLEETGLAPKLLELEVTEDALMENTSATRATLQTMHDLGIRIALDDFGTGYSSLAYLTRMPIGHLKIDKYFVAGLLEGGESKAIVRAVLAMAQSLDMQVTAEGVESLEQALLLKTLGCDTSRVSTSAGRLVHRRSRPYFRSTKLPPPLTIAQALVGQRHRRNGISKSHLSQRRLDAITESP